MRDMKPITKPMDPEDVFRLSLIQERDRRIKAEAALNQADWDNASREVLAKYGQDGHAMSVDLAGRTVTLTPEAIQ